MNKEQDNKKISDKILERISINEVTPTSRFYFKAKNVLLWLLAAFSIVIGAVVISIIIFRLSNARFFIEAMPQSKVGIIFSLLPIAWVVLLGVFGYLAFKEIRKTNKGYKYEFSTLMLVLLLASGVLGIVFHGVGSGYMLDTILDNKVPFHRGVEAIQRERFVNPDHGFIGGTVTKVEDESFNLQDPEGVEWQVVYIEEINPKDKEIVANGIKVRVIGEKAANQEFIACKIMLWNIAGKGQGLFGFRLMPPQMDMKHHRPFIAATSSTSTQSERNKIAVRNNKCEGVRPLTGTQ